MCDEGNDTARNDCIVKMAEMQAIITAVKGCVWYFMLRLRCGCFISPMRDRMQQCTMLSKTKQQNKQKGEQSFLQHDCILAEIPVNPTACTLKFLTFHLRPV